MLQTLADYGLGRGRVFPGMRQGDGQDRSVLNPQGTEVSTITITEADNFAYYIDIRGVRIPYGSDADGAFAEINPGLRNAAAANPYASELASLVQGPTTATIVVTAKSRNLPLDIAVSANLAVALTTAPGRTYKLGTFVSRLATTDGTTKIGSLAATGGYGVVLHDQGLRVANYGETAHINDEQASADRSGLLPGSTGDIRVQGLVWAAAEEVMAVGDSVYARFQNSTVLGMVRNDNAGGDARAIANAQVVDYDAAAGAVLLDLL